MGATPTPLLTLERKIRELQEQVRRLANSSQFAGTGWAILDPGQVAQAGSVTVPADGSLIVDGGDVKMLDAPPLATELFSLGVQEHGDRGITLRRQDGSVAWEVRKIFGPGDPSQVFALRDRVGRRIGGDALLSPTGFDAPHMEHRFIPVDYTSSATAQSTSSATFAATHEHRGFRQNPALKMQVMVQCSDAATTAEIQVWNVLNGAYLGGFLNSPLVHTITVPAGTTAFSLFEFSSGLAIPGSMSDPIHLQIHARVTAGSGSVSVAPVRTIGSGF